MGDQPWSEHPVVQRHLSAASKHAGSRYAESLAGALESSIDQMNLESPLEAIFWVWWECEMDAFLKNRLRISPQHWVEVGGCRFRLDFRVLPVCLSETERGIETIFPKIAVEVDGHTFHEKTPEQVAERNTRDRLLALDGWKVFHYSWSEVTSNPADVVGEVAGFANWSWWEAYRASARATHGTHS